MHITIRLANPADAQDMAEVGMKSWEVAYKHLLPADYIREKNATRVHQYKRVITDENTNSYVIQKDNKTVGIMKIAEPTDDDLDSRYFELHYLYLHPGCFREGIGTLAMDYVFDHVRKLGKKYISLWVFAKNNDAIKFYEACGFRPDGKTKTQERGWLMEIIRMIRDNQETNL